ncbi:MAG: competence protein ComFC [Patescibacteria group bacterium]|nr:competence protein ComFC [Patescibacteria group bacterium]
MQHGNLRGVFSKLIHIGLDIFLPERCVNCFRVGKILCDDCLHKLTPENRLITENIIAVFPYQDKIIKKLIWHLKFKSAGSVAEVLAPFLEETILDHLDQNFENTLYHQKVLLVPIPQYSNRTKARGYNQSKILVEKICTRSPENFLAAEVLIKTKNTPSQVSCKTRSVRLENIKNSFAIKPDANLQCKIVCVIDDVTTTGATLSEAIKILQSSRPAHIFAVTVAHG